jgi:hypothetical protein
LAAGGLAKHQVSPLLIAKGARHQRLTTLLLSRPCSTQVVIGMAILAMVYTMIIFNLIHHTIAALMGSFVALGKCFIPFHTTSLSCLTSINMMHVPVMQPRCLSSTNGQASKLWCHGSTTRP